MRNDSSRFRASFVAENCSLEDAELAASLLTLPPRLPYRARVPAGIADAELAQLPMRIWEAGAPEPDGAREVRATRYCLRRLRPVRDT